MNKVLVVLNAKGGVGKSTTVATLARVWAQQFPRRKPLVFDLDKQQTTRAFHLRGCQIIAPPTGTIALSLPDDNRIVIADCPPSLEGAAEVLRVATHILVPVSSDFLSVRAGVNAIEDLRQAYPDVPLRIVLTMFVPASSDARQARDDMRAEYGDNVFRTLLYHYRSIRQAVTDGKTIIDYAPDSNAALQYLKLADEVLAWLEQQ